MGRNERQYEAIKFTYSAEDIQERGQQLAHETQNVYDIKDKKKTADTEFGSQIKAAESRVSDLTTRLNNGYELREVEVLVLMDTPITGMKRVIRADNNEQVREEAMTLEEKQSGFGFD